MKQDIAQLTFDYSGLPEREALSLRMRAERIRTRMKRTAEDIVEIGRDLLAAKEETPHGQFEAWLASEFEMSHVTAFNFMNVAERYGGKSSTVEDLPMRALYLLAAPSTPETVREAVANGAVATTHAAIKDAVEKAKAELAKAHKAELAEAQKRIERLSGDIDEMERQAQRERQAAAEKAEKPDDNNPLLERARKDLIAKDRRMREMVDERKALEKRLKELEVDAAKAARAEARKADTQRKDAQRFSANAAKVMSAASDLAASKPDAWDADSQQFAIDAAAMITRAIEELMALHESLSSAVDAD